MPLTFLKLSHESIFLSLKSLITVKKKLEKHLQKWRVLDYLPLKSECLFCLLLFFIYMLHFYFIYYLYTIDILYHKNLIIFNYLLLYHHFSLWILLWIYFVWITLSSLNIYKPLLHLMHCVFIYYYFLMFILKLTLKNFIVSLWNFKPVLVLSLWKVPSKMFIIRRQLKNRTHVVFFIPTGKSSHTHWNHRDQWLIEIMLS